MTTSPAVVLRPRMSQAEWALFESRVEAFEAAWAAGERPRLADHLIGGDSSAGRLLVELIHTDLEYRLKAGEPARVEEYFAAYPELAGMPGVVEELVAAEYRLRTRREPGPIVGAELRSRFPQCAALLPDEPAAAETIAMAVPPPVQSPAATQVGRFRVEKALGQGGFGVVYLATDPALGRPVAVKIPQPHILANPALRARFLREARAAAGLEHPNIVPVHEAGEADGTCFLVSAFCPGPNLAEWLAERTEPVPPRTAAALVAVLADAVAYSHGHGVLHRDLKPANVMLAPRESPQADGLPFVPRLTDFGLAKVVEASLAETRTSVVMGTPLYMSPEQADGVSEVGPAADVYSLGVILYELLAGRVPFEGSLAAVLEQVRSADPIPPSRLRPGLPRDLETICLKCLSKSPAHRYASAGELATDLRRFLAGESIAARRLNVFQRLSLWARRPERVRDAGGFAVALNLLITVWMLAVAIAFAAGLHPMDSDTNVVAAFRDTLAVALATHLPLAWIGWMTLRRRRWAVHAGTVLSGALVALLFASWANPGETFGGVYEDPRLRFTILGLLLLLFAMQFGLYAAAEAALPRRRL